MHAAHGRHARQLAAMSVQAPDRFSADICKAQKDSGHLKGVVVVLVGAVLQDGGGRPQHR